MTKPGTFIVGITGGSGSGKTYLLHKLKEALPKDKVTYISQDDYYLPTHLLEKDEKGVINFDHPECINHKQLRADIEKLKNGTAVEMEEYTFNNPDAKPNIIVLNPAPVIIVEGLFCLYLEDIVPLLDLKVYVDADEAVMLDRRITRDADERGYDRDDVLYRYENHVLPAYQKFTTPFKDSADLVVDNRKEGEIPKAVDTIYHRLKNFL